MSPAHKRLPLCRIATIGSATLLLTLGAACVGPSDHVARQQVLGALDRYMSASRAVNADSIAANFAPTGTLFEPGIRPIESPDSIRAFVRMFTGAVVESASVTPETVEVHGSSAYLWGSYFERLSFPGQPRSEQRGRLVMHWVRQPNGQWLISRNFRVPLSTTVPAAPPK